MKSTISRYFISVFAALAILAAAMPFHAAPATTPAVDREAAEASFLEAYDHYINNRMWSSIRKFNESLEHNVYFVDAYFMRSLAYRRLGRLPDAISEMRYYLEVRQDDPRASTILDSMVQEWESIKRSSAPDGVAPHFYFTSHTMQTLFDVKPTTKLALRGLQGLGKITSDSSGVIICDTYGDAIWRFDTSGIKPPLEIEAARPVVMLPISPSRALLIQKSGDISSVVYDVEVGSADIELLGNVAANASDAEMIDSTMMAVADRTDQSVRFCGLPSTGETAEWRPDDSEETAKLFEPVALAAYGPFLAVADRGNQRVLIIDSYTLKERQRFDVPTPRDLRWGMDGSIYILSEDGTLYAKDAFVNSAALRTITSGMVDAWCFDMTDQGPLICSITGRTWWSSHINPGRDETIGAMSLISPWLEYRLDAENLMVRAAASSVYHSFIQNKTPNTLAIWRGEQRPSSVIEVVPANRNSIRFYSPSPGTEPNARLAHAASVRDIIADIEKMSLRGEEIPKVIVVDTRIAPSEEETPLLLAFLLHQGVRLDLWALSRPASESMAHLSRVTLGRTYFNRTLDVVPANTSYEWILSIPLPPDTYTFGYPSESTLSIYADIDFVRFIDWLPIWPSLLKGMNDR